MPLQFDQQVFPEKGKLACYLGHILSPESETTYKDIADGAMVVDENGIILDVGPSSQVQAKFPKLDNIIDYGKRLLMPGMVDMHLHLPQIAYTGRSGQSLLGWLQAYVFPAEASFADQRHAEKIADWFFRELALNGTTLACVFTTVHKEATDIAFQKAARFGSRVIMGKVMMDANSPPALTEDTQRSLFESEELCRKWHGFDNGRLLYAFTPRFAVSSTPELLAGCGKLYEKYPGAYLHTHLAETEEEVNFVAKQFPKCKSYLDVYMQAGLAGPKSVFAHSIHLSKDDLNALAKSKACLAHCPSSNFFLKSGVFPYKDVLQAKIRFGLGTDVAAGPQMSMFAVMKDACYMQRELWLAQSELFYRATLGGAKALCLDDKLGSLDVGKEADFIVVDPSQKTIVPADILERNADDILSSCIYLGDDRFVLATYVRGKLLYEKAWLNVRREVLR